MTASAGLAAASGRAAARAPIRRRSRLARKAFPYLLVAPAVLYLLAITLYPGVFAIYQSFFLVRFNQWIPHGWQNYVDLFNDREFRAALWNTLVIGGIALVVECALALLLAFHAYRDRWVRGWRIVFLVPMMFMPSAVAFLWKLAFVDGRVINDLLVRAGLVSAPVDWLANVWTARAILIFADVWQWTPFLFIIFVAALQGQDPEVEEAARLDGASWGQLFWNVSLPLIAPIIAVAVILRAIDIVTMFASVFIITAGTPGGATETVSYFVYRIGFRTFNFGYASAASVVLLAITVISAQLFVKRYFRSGRA